MGNCLVTKLKGSVSGNLPKIGELKLRLAAGSYALYLEHPEYLVIRGSSFTMDEEYLTIENKYNLTFIDSYKGIEFDVDTEDLAYSSISQLNLSFNTGKLTGPISKLPASVEYFCWMKTNDRRIEFKELGHMTSLYYVLPVLNQYNVPELMYGSIEDFVAVQRANGRTECSGTGVMIGVGSNILNTGITYQGVELRNIRSKRLTWDANGTITLSDMD